MGVITGTEGGKLELWDIIEGTRLAYINAFDSYIADISVSF